jgi:4-hydroxybenzoate polyprenyltransferase
VRSGSWTGIETISPYVASYHIDRETTLGVVGTVASTAIPFAIYTLALYAIYARFTRHRDPFHLALLAGTAAVLALSVGLAALGAGVATCLVLLMFAPLVTVVGYETVGHRHVAEALRQMT